MRIYLAGPMRGYPDNNHKAFAEAASALRGLGHTVWSPAEEDMKLGEGAADPHLREVFARDVAALVQQDAVVLLDGWGRSHGAVMERHLADVVGISVFYFSPESEAGMVALSALDWRWRAV